MNTIASAEASLPRRLLGVGAEATAGLQSHLRVDAKPPELRRWPPTS